MAGGFSDIFRGNLSNILETPDPEVFIADPLAKQKTTAADFIESLISGKVPREGVASLTGTEQFGQELLDQYVRGGLPGGLKSSQDFFSGIIDQPSDITQLPEYQAILKSIGAETSDATNRAFRRTQIAGQATSGAQGKAVGKEISRGSERMLAMLAPLAEAERGRQQNAASMLAQLSQLQEQLQQGRFGAIQQFGSLPRLLEQGNLSSLFAQQLSPFTLKAPIAQNLIGPGIDFSITQEPSFFEKISPLVIPLQKAGANAAASAMSRNSGGGGSTGGSSAGDTGTASTAASFFGKLSDRRAKENIKGVGDSIRKVKKIRAKIYNYRGTDPSDLRVGVLAQDVEKVLPGAVREINGLKHVDYDALTALAIDAVNELIREVRDIKKKVA